MASAQSYTISVPRFPGAAYGFQEISEGAVGSAAAYLAPRRRVSSMLRPAVGRTSGGDD